MVINGASSRHAKCGSRPLSSATFIVISSSFFGGISLCQLAQSGRDVFRLGIPEKVGFDPTNTRCDVGNTQFVYTNEEKTLHTNPVITRYHTMTPVSAHNQTSLAMETSGDRGHPTTSSAALLLAAQVFQNNGGAKPMELSSSQHEDWEDLKEGDSAEPTKSFLRRKVDAHIKKKTEKEREAIQRGMLAKVGEPMAADFIRINNNLSLQISRHTSKTFKIQ
jgi:hypothetical protein